MNKPDLLEIINTELRCGRPKAAATSIMRYGLADFPAAYKVWLEANYADKSVILDEYHSAMCALIRRLAR